MPWKSREKRAEYLKRYYESLRRKVIEKYAGENPRCKCCGEDFYGFLTIDHVVPNGAKDRKARPGCGWMLDILRADYDPETYQILCYNCNMYKRADGDKICHHQLS